DIGRAEQRPGADGDLRELSGDGGDRRRGCLGAKRDLDDAQTAFVKRAGERHGVALTLDRQDRDDGGATKQRMHRSVLLPRTHWCLLRVSERRRSRVNPCGAGPAAGCGSMSAYRPCSANRLIDISELTAI